MSKTSRGGDTSFLGAVHSIFMIYGGGVYHSWYFTGDTDPFKVFRGGRGLFADKKKKIEKNTPI